MQITAAQVRAARALVNMSQGELARCAGVGLSTVADFEREARVPFANNLSAIQRALELAGVEFTNGGQPGVRVRKMRVGDRVKYRLGTVDNPALTKISGSVCEIDGNPATGPVARVRVRFEDGTETPWEFPSQFEQVRE